MLTRKTALRGLRTLNLRWPDIITFFDVITMGSSWPFCFIDFDDPKTFNELSWKKLIN